jgi:prolyl oligopeptidase
LKTGIRRGCEPTNKLWIYKIQNGEIPKTENGILPYEKLIDTFDAKYDYLTNNGTEFLFCTTKDAPRKKVISIDISTKETKEIIPQPETAKFECVAPVNQGILFLFDGFYS